MKFLFIETYYLGSHASFVEGLSSCSSHDIDVVSMPGENWRWRMLGAALHVVESIPSLEPYDGIIISDLFNLSDFKALLEQPCPPVMVYFHENQITYPQPPGDKGAFQLGILNISTDMPAVQRLASEVGVQIGARQVADYMESHALKDAQTARHTAGTTYADALGSVFSQGPTFTSQAGAQERRDDDNDQLHHECGRHRHIPAGGPGHRPLPGGGG